ncbi:hypothetical protein GGF32_001362 [Allomyces javanicus]|nr:hypothetical protein GGF32_001362 [Allomyces javanicus]
MPRPPSPTRAFPRRWSPPTVSPVLVTLVVLALAAAFTAHAAPQSGGGSAQCIDVTPTDNTQLCYGFPKLQVPKNMGEFIGHYLPTNGTVPAGAPAAAVNSASDFQAVMAFAVRSGFAAFAQRSFKCVPTVLNGRWYKAMTCAAAASFAAKSGCPAAGATLCPATIDEFFLTFSQAVAHSSNNCPSEAAGAVSAMQSRSSIRKSAVAENCVDGKVIEGKAFCGFSSVAQACAHSCPDSDFIATLKLDKDEACKTAMSNQKPSPPPTVEFLSASSSASSVASSNSPSGTGAGAAVASAAPSATPSGTTDALAANSSGDGFMEKQVLGVQGKYWVFGGAGLVGVIAIVAGLLVVRKRKSAAASAAAKRDIREMDDKPMARGAPPADTFGNMPPGSPGEFGSGKHAEALDQGQYFDDRYGAPPPPPQGNGYPPSPAGAGYGNDYYGHGNSPAGPMPAPLPPNSPMNNNANASRSRETWAAVAPRQSVRPRSMMPHSVPRARPVVLSYAPRLEDELDLHRGDMVTLWEDNGDGYGYGQVADGREGVFPLMCLAPEDAPPMPPMPPQAPQNKQQPGAPNGPAPQEGGIRETVINPTAYRFTQYTVASDSDDDEYPPPPPPPAGMRGPGGPPPAAYRPNNGGPQMQQPQPSYGGGGGGYGGGNAGYGNGNAGNGRW